MSKFILKRDNGTLIILDGNSIKNKNATKDNLNIVLQTSIEKETLKMYTTIKTHRIIMPIDIVRTQTEYGYITRKINNKTKFKIIKNIDRDKFISEMVLLEEDIKNISLNKIFLSGLTKKDIFITINNKIFIKNIEDYKILKTASPIKLIIYNREIIKNLLDDILENNLSKLQKDEFLIKKNNYLKEFENIICSTPRLDDYYEQIYPKDIKIKHL